MEGADFLEGRIGVRGEAEAGVGAEQGEPPLVAHAVPEVFEALDEP